MTRAWTEWTALSSGDASDQSKNQDGDFAASESYQFWRGKIHGAPPRAATFDKREDVFFPALISTLQRLEVGGLSPLADDDPQRDADEKDAEGSLRTMNAYVSKLGSASSPLPSYAVQPREDGDDPIGFDGLPDEDALPRLSRDTILAVIIDVGVSLGHDRFRLSNGGTRFVSAWQQSVKWDFQKHIPFGRELYQQEIDDLLKEHGGVGWLDEETFNRETGVCDMAHMLGDREAEEGVSHGAHVADLVGGCDPRADPDFAERVRLMAVNVPSRRIIADAGEFVEGFILAGVRRALVLAGKLWELREEPEENDPQRGFPVVFNISFGRQAGSKVGFDLFGLALEALKDEFPDNAIEFVLPAGNSNLLRACALLEPPPYKAEGQGTEGAGETPDTTLNWRIQPDDQTSNFAEVWVIPPDKVEDDHVRPGGKPGVELFLTSPDGKRSPGLSEEDLTQGAIFTQLGAEAAVFCEAPNMLIEPKKPKEEEKEETENGDDAAAKKEVRRVRMIRYLLCVGPTFRALGDAPEAMAGVWRIEVRNHLGQLTLCAASIQNDQQILPGNPLARTSYFDDPHYRTHDETTGELIGTYAYPGEPGELFNLDIVNGGRPPELSWVRRHGTLNASTVSGGSTAIGGYVLSDGRPARYSSSGIGRRGKKAKDDSGLTAPLIRSRARGAPSVSFPSEDGPMHRGILAAGARSGTTVAMNGTSVACAQAARRLIDGYVAANPRGCEGEIKRPYLGWAYKDQVDQSTGLPTDLNVETRPVRFRADRELSWIEVIGRGRMRPSPRSAVNRMEPAKEP